MPADGVDLVDEQDAGAFSLAVLNMSRTRLAPDADEHLDELATR